MPKKEMAWVKLSGWLFILGIIIAIVVGLFPSIVDSTTITGVLAVLGFIIGLLGIAGMGTLEKCDVDVFLLAVIALMAAGGAGQAFSKIPYIGEQYLMPIVNYIGILVVPAAVLIALKAIWKSASTKF
jgi:hypothetical protein